MHTWGLLGMIRRKSSEVLNCLSLTQILSKLNITCCYCSLHTFEKQGWKGFRTKAWDGDFIEFRTQMAVVQEFRSEFWLEIQLQLTWEFLMEFSKNLDQNTSGKVKWQIIWWFRNSLTILIRILLTTFEELCSHLSLPEGKVDNVIFHSLHF